MDKKLLKCSNCNWIGAKEEVQWDTVETCMGNDLIEVCPKCGSMEVYPF
jgi:NAD-dependent SIR2 family protein deacetylase